MDVLIWIWNLMIDQSKLHRKAIDRDLAKRKHVIIRRREGKSEEREETNCDLQREREREESRTKLKEGILQRGKERERG